MSQRKFGRQVFKKYGDYLSNTIVGGCIYGASEFIVQMHNSKKQTGDMFRLIDPIRVTELGILGSLENGIFMTAWYNFLARRLGSGLNTELVVTKCFLDQIVFSTQSNVIFLGLCSVNSTEKLPQAVNELKRTFLTTWIADCALWPVVNFFGFAFVPMRFQPFYMVSVQFIWQVYASAVASENSDIIENDEAIEEIFRALDDDGSGFIDVSELEKELKRRGMKFNDGDLKKIMSTVDENGDGQISLEEFKMAIKSGAMKNTVLWGLLSEDLAKGAKAALKRLDNMKDSDFELSAAQEAKDKKNREDALKSASIGGSVLLLMSLGRKFILKI